MVSPLDITIKQQKKKPDNSPPQATFTARQSTNTLDTNRYIRTIVRGVTKRKPHRCLRLVVPNRLTFERGSEERSRNDPVAFSFSFLPIPRARREHWPTGPRFLDRIREEEHPCSCYSGCDACLVEPPPWRWPWLRNRRWRNWPRLFPREHRCHHHHSRGSLPSSSSSSYSRRDCYD